MKDILSRLHIEVSDKFYLKNPESSELGKRIIEGSITQINKLGFEQFNFRKLAKHIGSTEASIYRYFESKQKVLIYLSAWYWAWMEYHLVFQTANISEPHEQLNIALDLLTGQIKLDSAHAHINEKELHQIVISESIKAYMTKEVDEENKEGAYRNYKQLVKRVSEIVSNVNPSYKYPHMLISTVIEGAHLQRHFAAHLPGLTDQIKGEDSVSIFYKRMVFNSIQKEI